MPVAALARLVREHDTRIWRVIEHYVDQTRAEADYSEVTSIGIDETSARRGQDYVSLFMDLGDHGGDPGLVTSVCCDMSPAFRLGVEGI